jgi:hypothetical protein
MKSAATGPYADPEAAARKLIEIANSVEAVQDGCIHIELINGPMLYETPADYSAGLKLAIGRAGRPVGEKMPPRPAAFRQKIRPATDEHSAGDRISI